MYRTLKNASENQNDDKSSTIDLNHVEQIVNNMERMLASDIINSEQTEKEDQ
jgi:hypothetical protein